MQGTRLESVSVYFGSVMMLLMTKSGDYDP